MLLSKIKGRLRRIAKEAHKRHDCLRVDKVIPTTHIGSDYGGFPISTQLVKKLEGGDDL